MTLLHREVACMNRTEMEGLLRNLDARTAIIEQKLPLLLTRAEFESAMTQVATREDLAAVRDELGSVRDEIRSDLATGLAAVRDDLRAEMATKTDLATGLAAVRDDLRAEMATKTDLTALSEELRAEMATKTDLATGLAALREELRADMREEGVTTRRHFDIVAESLRDDIRLIAEGHVHLTARLDAFESHVTGRLTAVELDVARLKRRRR
jgi:hypothetical protein